MSANANLRVYAGNNVLLPGSQVPRPATVLVSTKTGKIIDVREGRHVRADYADIASDDDDCWIDVGDKYLLPGLVEYVRLTTCPVHPSKSNSVSPNPPRVFLQCACAPQRTWPDGLGGLLDGHACGCVWGHYHRRGHAAQLDPADDHGGEPCCQTQCGACSVLDRCCILGWCYPRQPSTHFIHFDTTSLGHLTCSLGSVGSLGRCWCQRI
jgi:hypothetical protein